MATINPQRDMLAGIAGQSADVITPDHVDFINGEFPVLWGHGPYTVLTGQQLAALTVVGKDGAGKLVPATEDGTVKAIGVLPYAVDSTSGDVATELYRSGNFNPDLLVWDASFTTAAQKAAAFEGAESPTQIIVTKTQTFAV